MNPRTKRDELEKQLDSIVKINSNPSDTLNRFKQCFMHLSGAEVDSREINRIDKWRASINEQK